MRVAVSPTKRQTATAVVPLSVTRCGVYRYHLMDKFGEDELLKNYQISIDRWWRIRYDNTNAQMLMF